MQAGMHQDEVRLDVQHWLRRQPPQQLITVGGVQHSGETVRALQRRSCRSQLQQVNVMVAEHDGRAERKQLPEDTKRVRPAVHQVTYTIHAVLWLQVNAD